MALRPSAFFLSIGLVASACTGGGIDQAAVATAETKAFQAEPSRRSAVAAAEAMGATGDSGWVPWLLDLHRLNYSTGTDQAAIDALAELTGIDSTGHRRDDFAAYGSWFRSAATPIDPGSGYREWKQLIYGRIDDGYPALLAGIDDATLPNVHWGGARRGDIPELNNPKRIPANEATFMVDDELVLGTVLNGTAVAYPVRILGRHELANDTIGGVPVSLVYCTLCRSALLFDRRVPDHPEPLEFETSGLLIDSNKVMVDRQTDTLWRHFEAVGIAGPLAGTELAQYPVTTSTWEQWRSEHPTTETLAIPDPIFYDDPERPPLSYDYSPFAAYADYYDGDDLWFPTLIPSGDAPLAAKESIIGLTSDGAALAVPIATLRRSGPQIIQVGAGRFVALPRDGGAQIYALASGDTHAAGPATVIASDDETITLSDATQGGRVTAPQVFWFAWQAANPNSDIWSP